MDSATSSSSSSPTDDAAACGKRYQEYQYEKVDSKCNLDIELIQFVVDSFIGLFPHQESARGSRVEYRRRGSSASLGRRPYHSQASTVQSQGSGSLQSVGNNSLVMTDATSISRSSSHQS